MDETDSLSGGDPELCHRLDGIMVPGPAKDPMLPQCPRHFAWVPTVNGERYRRHAAVKLLSVGNAEDLEPVDLEHARDQPLGQRSFVGFGRREGVSQLVGAGCAIRRKRAEIINRPQQGAQRFVVLGTSLPLLRRSVSSRSNVSHR